MRKKILTLLVTIVVMLSAVAAVPVGAAKKENFYWGVCGHSYNRPSYSSATLEKQIHLAAELGSKIYRVDIQTTPAALIWLDEVLSLCKAYGMEVMGIIYGNPGEDGKGTTSYEKAKIVSQRFAGRMKYIQINNEVDAKTIIGAANDGRDVAHYDMEKLENETISLNALSKGIREGDPNAKIVINMTWLHTGFLDYIVNTRNVDFDVIGLDWYWGVEGENGLDAMMKKLHTYNKDIFICESNSTIRNKTKEKGDADMGPGITKLVNDIRAKSYKRLLGYIIYELLDEPTVGRGEDYWGLVNCSSTGIIGTKKAAYYVVQELFGGGDKKFITLESLQEDSTSSTFPTSKPTSPPTTAKPTFSETTASTTETSSGNLPTGVDEPDPDEEGTAVYKDEVNKTGIRVLAFSGVFPKEASLEVFEITQGESYNTSKEFFKDISVKFKLFSVEMKNRDTVIQPTETVIVKIPEPKGISGDKSSVYEISPDGTQTLIEAEYRNKTFVFEAGQLNMYAVVQTSPDDVIDGSPSQADPPAKGNSYIWIIIISAVVLVAGCVFLVLFFIKKRKLKRQQ